MHSTLIIPRRDAPDAVALGDDDAALRRLIKDMERAVVTRGERSEAGVRRLERFISRISTGGLSDELTHVAKSRAFWWLATRLIGDAAAHHAPALFFSFDVDCLREVNEQFGRPTGDLLLRRASNVLRLVFRHPGRHLVGRVGGDEFAAVTLDAGLDSEEFHLRRLSQLLLRDNVTAGRPHLALGVGMARIEPNARLSLRDIVRQADARMREDKRIRRQE